MTVERRVVPLFAQTISYSLSFFQERGFKLHYQPAIAV
jgi:hypothetical protein